MKSSTTTGEICLKETYGLIYSIGLLSYTAWEDDSFRYEFTPNWNVIDLLKPPHFQGVPGFDLSTRKNTYLRENIEPIFISERTPARNREDAWQLLEECNMEYLNKLEWLIKTDTRYIGDELFVRALNPAVCATATEISFTEIREIISLSPNSEQALRKILELFCCGTTILFERNPLSAETRKVLYTTVFDLYKKAYLYRESQRVNGVKTATEKGVYRGRKRKALDELLLREQIELFESRKTSAREAAAALDISEATFSADAKNLSSQNTTEPKFATAPPITQRRKTSLLYRPRGQPHWYSQATQEYRPLLQISHLKGNTPTQAHLYQELPQARLPR